MPIFKNKNDDAEGWLSILLALRLRQIESQYDDYASFAEATGLSRGTLYQLRVGKGNPTFVTLERLARHLNVPVWSLIGRPGEEDRVREDVQSFGFNYEEISRHIAATKAAKRSMMEFSGIPTQKVDDVGQEKPQPTARRPRKGKRAS